MNKTEKANMCIEKEMKDAKARILYKYGVPVDQIAKNMNFKPEYLEKILKDVIPLEEFSEKHSGRFPWGSSEE